MRAAVFHETGDETAEVRDDVEVVPTEAGLVRIAIHATGVCHTDISSMNGTIPQPAPCVLGHEGAGEVVEVGAGVDNVHVGDHVIVSWVPPCGTCADCLNGRPHLCMTGFITGGPRFRIGDTPVHGVANTGTFTEQMVVPASAAIKIDDDVPWDIASLIGCGVMTGVGAAINTAQVRPGSSVVVFGCGGVGISVIQGARIAGAAEIVAVDLVEGKREHARQFGATHTASPDELADVSAQVTKGQGFDYAFEVVGIPLTIRAAYDAVRRGGTAVVVGAGRVESTIELNAFELFFMEKRLLGSLYGSADVRVDFDRLLRLWRTGRLDLEGMISQRVGLDDVNKALADMKRGDVIRTVIEI